MYVAYVREFEPIYLVYVGIQYFCIVLLSSIICARAHARASNSKFCALVNSVYYAHM